MLANLICTALPVFASYCALLWLCETTDANLGTLVGGLIALFVLNFALHRIFCVTGKIAWYVLPMFWAACVFPLYYASYNLIRPGFFGRDFTFQVYAALTLAPLVLFSFAVGAISAWVRSKG